MTRNKKEKMYLFDPLTIKAMDLNETDLIPNLLKSQNLQLDFFHKTIGNTVYLKAKSPDDELVMIGKRIFAGQQVRVTEAQKDAIIERIEPIFNQMFNWVVVDGIKKAFVEITDK